MINPAALFGELLLIVAAFYPRRWRRAYEIQALVGALIWQVGLWAGLWNAYGRDYPPSSAIFDFVSLAAVIAFSTMLGVTRWFRDAFVFLAFTFSTLLVNFTAMYWSLGGKAGHGFNERLTHLDALYYAVGTLTTAGTGSITALSTRARTYATVQMGLDFVLVAITLAVILGGAVSASANFWGSRERPDRPISPVPPDPPVSPGA